MSIEIDRPAPIVVEKAKLIDGSQERLLGLGFAKPS
jgi:hypothetical protein